MHKIIAIQLALIACNQPHIMTTKKALKYRTENIFERMTGLKIHEMIGGSGCHIVAHQRIIYRKKQHMTRAVAASLYYDIPIAEIGRVSSKCDVKNCVNPQHITFQSLEIKTKPDNTYKNVSNKRRTEKEKDKPDADGFFYGYHPDIWNDLNDAGKELCRNGEYSVGRHGFNGSGYNKGE